MHPSYQNACSLLYRYSADIRTLHGRGCTCNGAKQIKIEFPSRCNVWGTRFSMLDWVRVAGLSCTKGVWYMYDRDTG